MDAWLKDLPDHQVRLTTTSQLVTRNGWRGWNTQPRAECTCGWGEGSVTDAGLYATIRAHLRAHGWRAEVVA